MVSDWSCFREIAEKVVELSVSLFLIEHKWFAAILNNNTWYQVAHLVATLLQFTVGVCLYYHIKLLLRLLFVPMCVSVSLHSHPANASQVRNPRSKLLSGTQKWG